MILGNDLTIGLCSFFVVGSEDVNTVYISFGLIMYILGCILLIVEFIISIVFLKDRKDSKYY